MAYTMMLLACVRVMPGLHLGSNIDYKAEFFHGFSYFLQENARILS
jgi:hypothetical protein